ncbi:MAG: divalent-cation tolerance protein CutA [Bdellovibrionales bacterium]|nr:divalent-cation tolerance protein CutA [Bdellovibrionales bacterium]
METRVILVTCPTNEIAETIARSVVEARLAACVNLISEVKSIYRWQEKVQEDQEVLLVIKSNATKLGELEKHILELHPYDTPEFVALSPSYVNPKYSTWISNEL